VKGAALLDEEALLLEEVGPRQQMTATRPWQMTATVPWRIPPVQDRLRQ
jgi:hypothetical protein